MVVKIGKVLILFLAFVFVMSRCSSFSDSQKIYQKMDGIGLVHKKIAAGGHTMVLLPDGTILSWGVNMYGQLGDGTKESSLMPVKVKNISNAIAIDAFSQSMALLSDGTVMAWGDNQCGQLGNGTTKNSQIPVKAKDISNVCAIAVGAAHSIALLSNGTVMAWGNNEMGQLGKYTVYEDEKEGVNFSSTPLEVKGISNVIKIDACLHNIVLLKDRTIKGWGDKPAVKIFNSLVRTFKKLFQNFLCLKRAVSWSIQQNKPLPEGGWQGK
ncbi:MAG: hypothetical protein HY762_08800 [Planctomycetes bacterium]|nr:hypothetical protein [Planctomycetota bacterium]